MQYYFAKNVIDREDIKINHCSTDKMIADFYTKPLQGKHLYSLRQQIMGHRELSVQEHVENNEELTTNNAANKHVSRKQLKDNQNGAFKVSNNFD